MPRARCGPRALLSILLLAAAPAAAGEADVLARVAALEGRAVAGRPGEPGRALACGDPGRVGERVRTEPGAHLVLASEAHGAGGWSAHLPGASQVALGRGEAGGPAFALRAGAVRVLHERAPVAPLRFAAPSGVVTTDAPDVESLRRDDGALRVCAWNASGEALACRVYDADGAVHLHAAGSPEVDLLRAAVCGERSGLVRAADFASAPPVSAPAPGPPLGLADLLQDPEPPSCAGATDECGGGRGLAEIAADLEPLTVAPPEPALPPFPIP
jgi:hypothetical protein